MGFLRLAALTGDVGHERPALGVLRLLREAVASHPTAFAHLLAAVEWQLTAPLEIAVVGDPFDRRAAALWREAWQRFLPVAVRLFSLPGQGGELSPLLLDRSPERPTAYVCERFACRLPVDKPEVLGQQVDEALAARRGTEVVSPSH